MDETTLSILLLIFIVSTVLFMILWMGCKSEIRKLDTIVVNDILDVNSFDNGENVSPYVKESANELAPINVSQRLY